MTDRTYQRLDPQQAAERVKASINLRKRKETRFLWLGKTAVAIALGFLVLLFAGILSKGIPGLFQYYVTLDVRLDARQLDPSGQMTVESLAGGDFDGAILTSLYEALGNPEGRKEKREARRLISRETPEADRRISDQLIGYIDALEAEGRISYEISDYLFFGSASRDAEMAGIRGALVGSILTLLVCIVIAFPLGVATAVYLEEMAPKNRLTEIIEININNLAAVPSVVFGIMGLAIFIVAFGMPRSIPLVGGIVLALMTLPTIIISSRAAIRAVPPSIRDAALGVGASKMQTIMHHVLPLAMPGMLTGTIIGMAQALGETAPLLMIGMVAFIVDVPAGVTDPGTVLPVQIFMWADFAERMFVQKTSAAIIVLLAFLISMNAAAILLRKKLERRW